jgi:tetratricopeptide (TPR) repeat protein
VAQREKRDHRQTGLSRRALASALLSVLLTANAASHAAPADTLSSVPSVASSASPRRKSDRATLLRRLRDALSGLKSAPSQAEALARFGAGCARQGDRETAGETLRLAETRLANERGAESVRVAAARGGDRNTTLLLMQARIAGGDLEGARRMLPPRTAADADVYAAAFAVALARYGPAGEIESMLNRLRTPNARESAAETVSEHLMAAAKAALLRGDAEAARTWAAAIPVANKRDTALFLAARDRADAGDRAGVETALKGIRDYAVRDEVQVLLVGLLIDAYNESQNPALLRETRDIADRMKTELARRRAEGRILPARARTDFTENIGNRAKGMALSAAKVAALAGVARVRAEQNKPEEARALVREALALLPMVPETAGRDAARDPLVDALTILGEIKTARTVAEESENRVEGVARLMRIARAARTQASGVNDDALYRAAEAMARSRVNRAERAAAYLALARGYAAAGKTEAARSARQEAALAAQATDDFDLHLRVAAELRRAGDADTAERLYGQAVDEAARNPNRETGLIRIQTLAEVVSGKVPGSDSPVGVPR